MYRLYISAGHKSSGKTTVSIGLCAALARQGKCVQAFKKGPDYIDPLWLARASSVASLSPLSATTNTPKSHPRSCYNLDFNTQSNTEIVQLFQQHAVQGKDCINIIEGNKGLYDGVAIDGSNSNAALAKLTQTPVVLVIDARGVTRGVAPLLLGYQHFDKDICIAGVIYNFCGGSRHQQKLRAVTETYTDIPVLGMLQTSADIELTERHLGLIPSNEFAQASDKINTIADYVSDGVDLAQVFACAANAPAMEPPPVSIPSVTPSLAARKRLLKPAVKIAICEDEAFGFYYADDKQALIRAGAELVSVNTLKDACLPDDVDGLIIGGGFPETQLSALAANASMRQSIYDAIEAGLPTYAECGGLMYLSESVTWQQHTEAMVGVIPAAVTMHKKPQGRGYVELSETPDMLWEKVLWAKADGRLKPETTLVHAHEFHYSSLSCVERLHTKGRFAYRVHRGVGITGEYDGWVYKNLLANYAHLRQTDGCRWVDRFIQFVRTHTDGLDYTVDDKTESREHSAIIASNNTPNTEGKAHTKGMYL